MEKYHGNTVEYWKQNAEEDYIKTPISVLKYITVLEEQAKQLRELAVVGRSEQLSCSHCGRPLKEHSKGSKLCPDRMKNFDQGN